MYFDSLMGFASTRFCTVLLCFASPLGYASSMKWVLKVLKDVLGKCVDIIL